VTVRVIGILVALAAVGVAAAAEPATASAPAGPSFSPQQRAQWSRAFSQGAQKALETVTDGSAADPLEHPAFNHLLAAAGDLTDEQLLAAPKVGVDALLADPAAYRGRLVRVSGLFRRLLGPSEHRNTITGKKVLFWRIDCTVEGGGNLIIWATDKGGHITPYEDLVVGGFFYKTFTYEPEDGSAPALGLAMVTRRPKPPAPPPWEAPSWLPYVLGGAFVAVLAVAVAAVILSRRPRRAARRSEAGEGGEA
jgi:hypothetical protein